MDYKIVKQNLTKPKQVRIKKEKLDFTQIALKHRALFVVPNKKSYKVSKQINDERLDDDMYAVFKMNNILNTHTFYSRDYVYQCGVVSFAGEYFCRLFGYDGIFIKTEIIDNDDDLKLPFSINEENPKIFIKSLSIENIHFNDALLSSSYLFSALKILGIFKIYENNANVLNSKTHLLIDEYICLLNIINTALELYHTDCKKHYFLFENKNSITFTCFAYICKALISYYPTFCEKIEQNCQKNFILSLMENLFLYCYDNTLNSLLSLEKLYDYDNELIKLYKLHFGRRGNAQTIISSTIKFQNSTLMEDFKLYCSWINKCSKIYCEHYIKQTFEQLPNEYVALLKLIISKNGYNLSPQLCEGFIYFNKKDIKAYNYYFNTYNKLTYNNFKIKDLLRKINKSLN